jgi:protein dithiol:quinone oxidoreductase
MADEPHRISAAQRLVVIAVLCIASVAAALVAQHGFDMQPCPWCILQRVIFLLIALVCGVAALVASPRVRITFSGAALVLALSGVASAMFQHQVAAKSASCNLTLADKIITALGLESVAPALFGVTANCADAAVDLLGVPFEFWSLAMYVLIGAIAVWTLASLARRPPSLRRGG